MAESPELIARVRREVEALADEFHGIFGIETIQRCADEAVGRLETATVFEYVPLFVYKYTRE